MTSFDLRAVSSYAVAAAVALFSTSMLVAATAVPSVTAFTAAIV